MLAQNVVAYRNESFAASTRTTAMHDSLASDTTCSFSRVRKNDLLEIVLVDPVEDLLHIGALEARLLLLSFTAENRCTRTRRS